MSHAPICAPTQPIGIYALVKRANQIQPLAQVGIVTFQLRIKDLSGSALESEIKQAITLAQQLKVKLYINDYWQLAIQLQADGVHLGQEDLMDADLTALQAAGIDLGISTHTPQELETALKCSPNYIAIGPIFNTQTKHLAYPNVGLTQLKNWVSEINLPVVAIGGITRHNLPAVVSTGVQGVALISALSAPGLVGLEAANALVKQFEMAYQTKQRHPKQRRHLTQYKQHNE